MFTNKESKGGLKSISPKTSFIFGLIAGLLIVCSIGFFILLAVYLDNKNDAGPSANINTNVNQQAGQPSAEANLAKNLKKITKDNHLRGDLNAKVVMVEFSDLQCPYCSRAHDTLKQLVDNYDGDVAWVYKHFPLDSLHPYARKAAEASECANDQGKFWEFIDELYANQSSITLEYLSTVATQLDLNINEFNNCVTSNKYANKVNDDYQEGTSVGVTGTPGIYVNDQLIKGAMPYENFKQVIDSML